MSWPKRLLEEEYTAAVGEAEAYLHEHLSKEVKGDRSMTRMKATLRIWRADDEGRAIFEAETSRLEIREQFCRNLIALAKGGDKQAKVDLQMLHILFLEDVIAARSKNAEAPDALLRYHRDELERALPYDKDHLNVRQIHIATAVDMVLAKLSLSDIRATRNQASRTAKHPESACSLVASALGNVGRAMSENNVQKAWETYGVLCSKNLSAN